MKELLKVKGLNISFHGENRTVIPAVKDLNFHINEGETVGLVGESGCGKSLTSLSIMQLIPKQTGKTDGMIVLDGEDVNTFSEKEMRSIRGRSMSMIFQEPMTSLNPVHKIGKQIGEVIELHSAEDRKTIQDMTIDILRKVGIPRPEKIIHEYPHQLSGGMRQRVMIAMAMACNPKLLIADEPTTALDVTIQAQILELMKKLQEEFKTSILLITHDLGVVAEMADRVLVMYYGEIVEEADVRTIFRNPKHPYTIGLLKSIPTIDDEEEKRLEPIQGTVPNIGQIHYGCPFRFRCNEAIEKCNAHQPPLYRNGQHSVRCWLFEDKEVWQ